MGAFLCLLTERGTGEVRWGVTCKYHVLVYTECICLYCLCLCCCCLKPSCDTMTIVCTFMHCPSPLASWNPHLRKYIFIRTIYKKHPSSLSSLSQSARPARCNYFKSSAFFRLEPYPSSEKGMSWFQCIQKLSVRNGYDYPYQLRLVWVEPLAVHTYCAFAIGFYDEFPGDYAQLPLVTLVY